MNNFINTYTSKQKVLGENVYGLSFDKALSKFIYNRKH